MRHSELEDYVPPCWQRDEWTRDTNKNPVTRKEGVERVEDATATLRAQFICTTRCKMRQQCMDWAMSIEDNDHYVFGGYTGWERARIREDGALPVPVSLKAHYPNWARVNELMDTDDDMEALAGRWGMTAPSIASTLRSYLWLLRVENEHASVVLQDDGEVSDELPQTGDNVRAA